ncbi:hypothetical protein ASD91_15235 [Pseudomonas sp. Root68]|nr:hypothetical protein ASD91_15235 [Pseudomonas sp. Root68]KRB70359.1 hypothetical protein ASD95_24575 [Pseudomonas sp. Root71]
MFTIWLVASRKPREYTTPMVMMTASKYKQEKSLLFLIKIIFSFIRNTLVIIGASAGGPTRHLLPNEVESGSDQGKGPQYRGLRSGGSAIII